MIEVIKQTTGVAVGSLQQQTRIGIVEYLKLNGSGVTQDFIKYTGDSDNNVRRALRYLNKHEIIINSGKKKTGISGNPPILWKLG